MVKFKYRLEELVDRVRLSLMGLGLVNKDLIKRQLILGYDAEYYFEEELYGPSHFVAYNSFTKLLIGEMFINKYGDDKRVLSFIKLYNKLNSKLTKERKRLLRKNKITLPFKPSRILFLHKDDRFILRFINFNTGDTFECKEFDYPPLDSREAVYLCKYMKRKYIE